MRATLHFNRCEIGSMALGATEEHHTSTVYFDYELPGRPRLSLSAAVKQTSGGRYERDPLEVRLPDQFAPLLHYQDFRRCVERYYRTILGKHGHGVAVDQ